MQRVKLNVTGRSESGTTKAKQMRREGIVPGIIYGKGKKSLSVKVSLDNIHQVKGSHIAENVLVDLIVTDGKKQTKKTVMIKEIQKDAIRGDWLHIDFNEISLKDKIKTPVHIELKGEAKGVVEGGVLDLIIHELEVECLPTDIPSHIEINVTDLEIGHTLYVKDLGTLDKAVILNDPEAPVVSVAVPRVEEEAPAEVVEGEEATEPEVISKGKKEKEGEEAEDEAKAEAPAEKKPKQEKK